MIKAVIFDCFGVLVEDALGVMRDKLKVGAPDKYEEIIDILHANHRGLITSDESNKRVAELLGLSDAEYRQQLSTNEIKNVVLMDYILELKKNYKTAILSNIGSKSLLKRFSKLELADHFDEIVASGDVGFAKPEAQIYEITADRLGVRLSECVFTDDNERFCEAARGLGMQAIAYEDFAQFKAELEKLLA